MCGCATCTRERPGPGAAITFDPDLWVPYTPPPLVSEWSGVLYPALRLRPLRTEMVEGWAVTLVVCAVFLHGPGVGGARSIVTRSGDLVQPEGPEDAGTTGPAGVIESADAAEAKRPATSPRPTAYLRLVLKGWYATLLAAVLAAFVDGRVLRWFAPRRESGGAAADQLGVAIGDAVRFGAAWGGHRDRLPRRGPADAAARGPYEPARRGGVPGGGGGRRERGAGGPWRMTDGDAGRQGTQAHGVRVTGGGPGRAGRVR
ncbi:hypothetical protein SCALM49S_03332 [Streptomyces californicus]